MTYAPRDQQGKHANRPQKLPDNIRLQIDTHIRAFPTMKSHYSRGKQSRRRRYLSPQLNVSLMYELYVEKFEPGVEKPLVSYKLYLRHFNENFNISFGYPRSDTCSTCDQLQVQLDAASDSIKNLISQQKEDHLRKAESFYGSLRVDTCLAKQDKHIATITFDFQQNFPLPSVPVGEIFYMHQLWLYAFGVHNCGNGDVRMYCWPETVSGRGSDEVVSCLLHYLTSLPEQVTTLYLYSDGCGGQNKNANVMYFLFSLVRLGRFQHIRHYFPVRGHSFLPNDRDFGCTEMKKRKVERVFSPDQWYNVIRSARRRNPFVVVPVDQTMILDCSAHFSVFFKKNINAGKKKLNLQRAMILDYSSQHPGEVWVKYGDENEEWSQFTLEKRRHSAIRTLPTSQKHHTPLPIKQSKVSDIRKIVEKYVPTQYHSFYMSIRGDEDVSSDTAESGED